jgi:hypothetical protein
MIQSYKMKKSILLIFLQLSIVILFFLPMMSYKVLNEKVVISGIEAIFTNEYFIFGNILLAIIFVSSILILIGLIYETMYKNKKYDDLMTIITNIKLFAGLITVTFLGTYIEWIGLVMIALLVLNTYLNYMLKSL